MKKYLIKKGSTVLLCRHEDFPPRVIYDTMISEQDTMFTENERIKEPYPKFTYGVIYYYYFNLPENDRGYRALAAAPSMVEIIIED